MARLYPLFLYIALVSCQPRQLSVEELLSFVADEDNGLRKSIEVGHDEIAVTYKPTDLWVHQDVGSASADNAIIESLRSKYSPYYYFIVSLSHQKKEALHQVGNMHRYGELVQTMSFHMSDYVTLTTANQDTIPVGDFMLNRTYGLGSSTDLLFVFERKKATGSDWVQVNLKEFGLGLGNRRFRFSTKDLEETPCLDFKVSI